MAKVDEIYRTGEFCTKCKGTGTQVNSESKRIATSQCSDCRGRGRK